MNGQLVRRTVAAAVAALTLASCASFNINALPQPGDSYRDGYDIVLEFNNVLNLPDRAKVLLDGVPVGVVTKVILARGQVDVTSRIRLDIAVPADVDAVLQQATVLGDIYVALERPHGVTDKPALRPGGRIPLAQTTSPPQLEDTLASLATFVSSGSIQRVQNTVIRLNRLTPPTEEVRRLSSRVESDLSDLAQNIDQVDQVLAGVSQTAQHLATDIPALDLMVSPAGQLGFERGVFLLNYVATLLPGVGSVYSGGFWLVPLLQSAANAAGAAQQSKWDFEHEVPAWRRLFTNLFLPQDRYPAINITSIVGPDGRELSGNVQEVLRLLGAVP
jgi:phospholipid/cholesterol/gamma-HCH transport system substrate-binding protein